MISIKSIFKFVIINTTLSIIGYCKYYYSSLFFINEIFSIAILYKILSGGVDKPLLLPLHPQPVENYQGEFYLYIVANCLIKAVTHKLGMYIISNQLTNQLTNSLNPILFFPKFIVISFAFEIIFDLFHYIIHRTSHSTRFLYKFHKVHHHFNNPNIWTSFYMHPIDSILSYTAPFLLTMTLVRLTEIEMWLITVYLAYQELAGHLGKKMHPTSCFPQCIWIPKILGIELYTRDHHLHHSLSNCNYSKRFNLWDKTFNTFTIKE